MGGASLKKGPAHHGVSTRIAPSQIAGLASEIEKRLKRSKLGIPVGVSNRHCHLTREHFKVLFGPAAEPKRVKDIKQPGFFAAEEVIEVKGPKGTVKKVRLVAPYRDHTESGVAVTDAFAIGRTPPVRESGDVKGSAGATLIGPAGQVDIREGVIVAQRHLHFSPAEAKAAGMASGEVVRVRCGTGQGRSTVFEDVVVRVSDKYSPSSTDTDEANAAGIKTGDRAHRVRRTKTHERPRNDRDRGLVACVKPPTPTSRPPTFIVGYESRHRTGDRCSAARSPLKTATDSAPAAQKVGSSSSTSSHSRTRTSRYDADLA